MEPTILDNSDSSVERAVEIRNTFNKYLLNDELLRDIATITSLRGKSSKILEAIQRALGELSKDVTIDQAVKDLELVETESPHAKKLIYDYLVQECLKSRFLFHAFNGVFMESINQYGLDPTTRLFDQGELDAVRTITDTKSRDTLLGWQEQSKGKVYLLGVTPDTLNSPIYRYGVSSPEWFAQFCQGGSRLSKDDRFDSEAFMRKDYEASKRNIETYLSNQSSEIDEAERTRIRDLFEKYWNIFAGPEATPKLAIVNALAVKDNLRDIPYERLVELGHDRYPDGREIPIDVLARQTIELMLREQDFSVDHTISPKDIVVIDLPGFTSEQAIMPQAEN
jgi:hypothetical protein